MGASYLLVSLVESLPRVLVLHLLLGADVRMRGYRRDYLRQLPSIFCLFNVIDTLTHIMLAVVRPALCITILTIVFHFLSILVTLTRTLAVT